MLGEALGGIDNSAFSKRNLMDGADQPKKRINRLLALDESDDGSDHGDVGLMRHNT